MLSWRVALLPFLNHDNLHRRFRSDEPWNSEHNRKLIRLMPDVFDVGVYVARGKDAAAGYTHAVGPTMKGSLWDEDEDKDRTVYDIRDGSAYTMAAFAAPPNAAVVWTKPDDLAMSPETVDRDMFGERQYCLITTFDGAKFRIVRSSSNDDLKALITFDGREEVIWNNFMPWLKTRHTSNPPRTAGNWTVGLPDNTTDAILEKRLARKPDMTSLTLSHTQVTAAGLRHLQGLPALKRVSLNDAQATDAGLEHLQGVPTLESLNLYDAPVTDVGLKHFGALTNLKILNLGRTKITDAGLSHLEGLKALEDLRLNNTQVTDAGLIHLRGLTNLKRLSLSDTDVTDAGLENLEELTNLELLILTRTLVAGAGLEHLRGMTKLKSLYLTATPLSDAGLDHLKGLENLTSLDLRFTHVSADAVKDLKATLPKKCYAAIHVLDPNDPTSMSYGLDARSGTTGTIRQGVWKLYARSRSIGSIALFDLSKDPLERHNVAADHPDVAARLRAELRHWILTARPSDERSEWLRHHGNDR